ncbi:AAA domain-containing protein [Xanthomonas hortorum]|uniref:AAA domain-containing protein n=1 Tax=Xanthomonas hortorum TaxID=56454 RepID=UPI001F3B39B3|nr:AAA domain-containing protein [Xanthomonas hortorum]MCE4361910.1 AAA domain-containing protein [Xanthomonas hortorum]
MADPFDQAALDYWHSVEFFNVYDLDEQLDKARKNRPVHMLGPEQMVDGTWQSASGAPRLLYLLPFCATEATRIVAAHLSDPEASSIVAARDSELSADGCTCFARLKLSADGRPDFEGISFSALPWAMGQLQSKSLHRLSMEQFEQETTALTLELGHEFGNATAVFDAAALSALVERLVQWAGYRPPAATALAWMEVLNEPQPPASSALQTESIANDDESSGENAAEDLLILNSFFVYDLTQARRALKQPAPPRALQAYLAETDVRKLDLDSPKGHSHILETLRPGNSISGRWPSLPGQCQSLMQQFALNKMKALQPGQILAVNGPPGTGKTTLLRDLIAHLVVERAGVLAGLTNAKQGLSTETLETQVFGKPMYKLAPALTGYEIVVASTNNGAVENLSLELPQCSGIDPALVDSLRYFQPVATKYAGSHASKPWTAPQPPVWGLVSAALGKKANRTRFNDIFVYRAAKPDERPDKYLAKAKVDYAAWEKVDAQTYWRYREKHDAQTTFKVAQEKFTDARAAYEKEHAALVNLEATLSQVHADWERMRVLCDGLPKFDPLRLTELAAAAGHLAQRAQEDAESLERRLLPKWLRWLSQIFDAKRYRQWCTYCDRAMVLRRIGQDAEALAQQCASAQVAIWDGNPLDSHANQANAFWQGARLNQSRNAMFAAAMVLHEAFFLEAQPNIATAISNFLPRPAAFGNDAKALWQWLFMLTPVVSTTFASVRRQFVGLGSEDLGWLIVDEAGQAPPQAAVGAIMRAQRVVVVGDPLQIPPVVPHGTRLLQLLGNHWLGQQHARYAVDKHSVQTLSDRAYAFGVRHPASPESFIGVPLVMHRRCDAPMFGIANQIAYANRMKHAKNDGAAVHPTLGPSSWWHVDSMSEDGSKFVPAQAQRLFAALVDMYISQATTSDQRMPDVFVITPFREVKRGLRSLLCERANWVQALAGRSLPVPTKANLEQLESNIGTVHTFQGKERDIVFFVLGCDSSHSGAIDWASGEPNILNVAVTRAKKHLYVIGDRNLWGSKRYFDTALAMLKEFQAGHAA